MLLGLPIFIFGENIAKIWINQNFELSIFLLTGFFMWTIMINFNGPLSMFLNNQIYLKKQLIMVFLATIGTIMLQIIFCYIFGLNGVIYGAIIPNIIFYIVPGYILALKK